ncbi:MAG TPA: acetate kinase [Planctomycetaceae bacterium]|nr:acetate kinase [Planctomycetaceae bacterium]
MSTLVLNAGSSSLKFGLFDDQSCDSQTTGLIDWAGDDRSAELTYRTASGEESRRTVRCREHRDAMETVLSVVRELRSSGQEQGVRAVGHRVVHGGVTFSASVPIDRNVKQELVRLAELAPLHNPAAIAVIEAAEAGLPEIPQFAVFDTAFFSRLPHSEQVYPLPYEWFSEWGIRRFGFHGISHSYCAGRAAEMLERDPSQLRLVICHLGNGCSASAVRGGVPVATTMGFTPLEGLMMGTRPGSVDPGILLHVQRRHGVTTEQLDAALHHNSGLLGVSGVSSDFREVDTAAEAGHERARLAWEMYSGRIRAAVGSLTVQLGGLDALVFTAGVGENSARLRAAVCEGLECLGLTLDANRNADARPDTDVATPESTARVLVVHTREDLMIARETQRLMQDAALSD